MLNGISYGKQDQLLAVSMTAAAILLFGFGITNVALAFSDRPVALFAGVTVGLLATAGIFWRPVYGPIVIFLTFLIGSAGISAGFASIQGVQAAIFLVAAVLAMRSVISSDLELPWSRSQAWLLALVAWAMISLFFTVDVPRSVNTLMQLIAGTVLVGLIVSVCRTVDDLRLVAGGFVAVAAGAAVLTIATGAEFALTGEATTVAGRATGPILDQPNQLGSYTALALPIAVGFALGARRFLFRLSAFVGAILILTALMLTLSRGAWIGAVAGLAFLLLRLPQARRWAIAAVPVVALAFAIAPSWPGDDTQVEVIGARARALATLSRYDERDAIYAEAVRQVRDAPVVGQGPGAFSVVAARAESEVQTVLPHHAHNLPLNVAAEMGIPAALLLVGFVIHLGLAARGTAREMRLMGNGDEVVVVAIAAALVTVGVHAMVDYVLSNAINAAAIWAVVGMLLAARELARRWRQHPGRSLAGPGAVEAATWFRSERHW